MRFNCYNLRYVDRGSIVEITLERGAANVRLMDTSNLNKYKSGHKHTYYGGLVKRSPFQISVPRSGNWYVTVDTQGLSGTVRSGVRVIPVAAFKPLPAINETPLRNVPTLVRNPEEDLVPPVETSDGRIFDVFISHASEDKDEVVRPFANALRSVGLSVWYDEFELRIGDSLRRKIDKGLANSRFGVVILSQAFFGRGWPEYELDGLVTRSVSGNQILLPIWHKS